MNSTVCNQRLEQNDTRGSRNDSLSSAGSNTNRGLVKLLSCFGLIRERQIPDKNILSLNNGAEGKYADGQKQTLEAAATKLLRESINLPPTAEYTQVRHTRQLETWDCGIACLQIAVRWLRGTDCAADSGLSTAEMIERRLLLEDAATRSIWTVDLVMLLDKLLKGQKDNHQQPNHDNTTYLFCSEVMGVNASHSTTGYYENAFDSDSARVSKIFEEMHSRQLPMLCPFRLEFSQLVHIASYAHCIAIILVDNSVLMHPLRNTNVANGAQSTRPEDVLSAEHKENDTYAGHYVILCGKNTDSDNVEKARAWERRSEDDGNEAYCLVLANPGIPDQIMFVTPQLLKQAWRAPGTDCDLIFIAKHF